MPVTWKEAWPLCLSVPVREEWPLCNSHREGGVALAPIGCSEGGVAFVCQS